MQLIRTATVADTASTDLYNQAIDQSNRQGDDAHSPIADLMREHIRAGVDLVEAETRQALFTSTYCLYLDAWPDGRSIALPRPPLQSVASVKYLVDGVEQTLAPAAYTVDPAGSMAGRVTLNPNESWPTADERAASVRVTFTAGYGTECESLPHGLRHALRMLFAHWHEQREAVSEAQMYEVPMGARRILDLHQWPEAV
jgi:uncharacterized phiE125 gp8 family phage protein